MLSQPEQPGRTYYGNPADVGPYGSLPASVEGNVLPLEGEPQVLPADLPTKFR